MAKEQKRHASPLDLAILNDDLAAIGLLKNNPELVIRKNWLHLNALELASLLGKEDALKILLARIYPPIAIQPAGSDDVGFYNRQEFENFFGVHYAPTLLFDTVENLEQLIKSCPILLQHTVVGAEHRYLGSLHRQEFFGHFHPKMAIQWIDEEMGYGLFALEPIQKESYIGEYTGIVREVRRFSPGLNGYCIHLPTRFWSYDYWIIDAEKAGNELRFANHSDQPNMRPFCMIDRGLVHIGFFALADIQPGCELTFHYGNDYWKKRQKRKKI